MRLIINGRHCEFDGETISYEEAVRISGAVGQPTVTYSVPGTRYGGELQPGESARVLDGMVLNAADTSRA